MAKKGKRGAQRRRSDRASKAARAKGVPSSGAAEPVRRCWFCSRPLGSSVMTSLLGRGVFEVHPRCYERALGLESTD